MQLMMTNKLISVFNHAALRKNIPPKSANELVRRTISALTHNGEPVLELWQYSYHVATKEALPP